ncbi:MAG: hypothetical protein EBT77_05200 [Verrucomicrobia bacterium]|nr:hypothetical protein [Verrucomicrobiota bacterium]
MGEPGSEAFSWDQQVVNNDQEIVKKKVFRRYFFVPIKIFNLLLNMVIRPTFVKAFVFFSGYFFIWE